MPPFTDERLDVDEAWGYAVQAEELRQRLVSGERVVGAKLGLTSAAKQQRMGVDRPIVGFLTDTMLLNPELVGEALDRWVQPRIEPEIAFVTARTIDRALPFDEVAASIATVMVAAEVIDSRYTDYRFGLPDVVADNTSAAGVLVGDPVPLAAVGDLALLNCEVEIDGTVVHRATGAAILGHPLRAVQLLTEHLQRHGESLPAGSVVLAGALTDAVPLLPGRQYRLSIERLGTIVTKPIAWNAPRHHPILTEPELTMTPDPTPTLITSHAEVTTYTPGRYAKQLVAHLGRKLRFTVDGATSTAAIGDATGQIVVGDGVLTLVALGADAEAVATVEHVLGSHLERFGQRNELTVTWKRATGGADAADGRSTAAAPTACADDGLSPRSCTAVK